MNRQFLFIKSATESIALPVDSFSHSEYTSATTISLYFDAKRSGKDASVKVVLTVTSGKAQDVMNLITGHVASSNAAVMKYDAVNSVFFSKNVTGITSITITDSPSITTGPTGPAGATGPTGPAGADGADGAPGADGAAGQGVPTGGSQFQVLRKVSGTDYDTEWDFADRVTLEVRFDEAVSKGDPLYITGYNQGQSRITVAKADASDSAQMPSIGLAYDDYSQNDNGQAITIGSLADVDTSSFTAGDVLYVASGGGITSTKPTGTNLIQNVGKVGRSNANNGEIVVMAIGRSNDLPNLAENKIWKGDSNGVPEQVTSPRTGNLCTLSGRFQFDSDDDNRTIITGNSSFGTNYYLWNTEVFNTIDDGTVDTTTYNLSNTYAGLSFRLPSAGKVRWDFSHKPVNSTGYSQNYRAQIWSASSFGSTVGATAWTLRADKEFTSNNTTGGWLTHDVTTTSSLSEGDYVLFTVGLDDATISATVYLSFQSTVQLVD